MIIKVYAWIPRSYVHIAEVIDKSAKGLIDYKVKESNNHNYISFDVNEFEGYKNLSFVLDSDGLYSLSVKLPEGNPEKSAKDFLVKAKRFLMDRIIKSCHKVTYAQIIEGILPINYSTVVMSSKEHAVTGYNRAKLGSLVFYSKDNDYYMNDSFTYVSGSLTSGVEEALDYRAFGIIMSRFFYEMMNKMESYHNGTKEVIRLLEHEPESNLINNAYLNLDLVKKDASESWAKVEQGIDCFFRKKRMFDCSSNSFNKKFGNDVLVERINSDKEYIMSLWTLLINHLEHVDTAVEARVNYTNMNSQRANQWLGAINSGFIMASIILGLFIVNSNLSIQSFIVLVLGWVGFYELVSFLIMKRKL